LALRVFPESAPPARDSSLCWFATSEEAPAALCEELARGFSEIARAYRETWGRASYLSEFFACLDFVLRPEPARYLNWPAGFSFVGFAVVPASSKAAPGSLFAFSSAEAARADLSASPLRLRWRAALSPELPAWAWGELARDVSLVVRVALAQHPRIPSEVLDFLCRDETPSVRRTAREIREMKAPLAEARGAETKPERLHELLAHPRRAVRRASAENPRNPHGFFTLAMHGDTADRLWVARNPGASAESVALCTVDRVSEVERAAVANPKVPAEALSYALGSEDRVLARAALENPVYHGKSAALLLAKIPFSLRYHYLNEHPLSLPALRVLLKKREISALCSVASHPGTSPEGLRVLSASKNAEIMAALARHPRTPPDILASLARCEAREVRFGVAQNANTPPEVLDALFPARLLSPEEQEAQGWSGIYEVAPLLAMNPASPPELLARLVAQQGDERVRRLVSVHPKASEEMRRRLLASLSVSS
jgi:hypothetical protein